VWKKSSREEALTVLSGLVDLLHAVTESSWVKENLEKLVLDWTATKEYQKGAVLSPLRVALSGQQNSPGPFEIAAVLGKSESLHRLKHALGVLS
jgi:glutamyl-tRNA synthetase